jgi:hypothetical protein
VSAVRVGSIERVDLKEFDVIVLPSGSYSALAGEDALRRLREWIRTGGTLVTLAEASRWAASERVDLVGTRTELRGGRPEVEERPAGSAGAGSSTPARPSQPEATSSATSPSTFDYDKSIQPERERPENIPGAIVRVHIDQEHWLSSGQDSSLQALIEGQRVFTPIRLDRGRNVGVYAPKDNLIASPTSTVFGVMSAKIRPRGG